jgi:type VI secretion system protein ImpH
MAAPGGSPPPDLNLNAESDAHAPAVDSPLAPRADDLAWGDKPWANPLDRPLVRLEGTVKQLFEHPYQFSFYQAVRLLHQIFPDREPVGRGGAPEAEPVRFRTLVSLSFPPSAVYNLSLPTPAEPVPVLTQPILGLTGPSGVLPRHYTELLLRLERDSRGHERTALRDWLDVFNNRIVGLFYRSWEKYRYQLAFERGECDRDEPDAFTQALLSLVGLGQPMLRHRLVVTAIGEPGSADSVRRVGRGRFRQRRHDRVLARVDDLALLYYAGLFAHRPRNAISLKGLLSDYFGLPVEVLQFRGQWLTIEPENQTRLDGGVAAQLGVSAVAGEKVWTASGKVRVRFGPLYYEQFLDLLPDPTPILERKTFFMLAHLVRLYAGPELDFEAQLSLRADEIPEAVMPFEGDVGPGSRLGWNAWLRSLPGEDDANDAVFPVEAVARLGGVD